MLLADVLARHHLERDIEARTIRHYGYFVRSLARFLGRPPRIGDLTDDTVNGWIVWMRGRELARPTIKAYVAGIMAIWRTAWRVEIVDHLPRRVQQVRLHPPLVHAYTEEQVNQLLRVSRRMSGRFPYGVPHHIGGPAYIRAAWDTGVRPCDMRALSLAHLCEEGVVCRQQKTGEIVVSRFNPGTLEALMDALPPGGERFFPMTKEVLCRWFRKLRAQAGLPGSPKWIRRAGATAVELAQPGSAQAYLGHKTAGLAMRHYVDLRQIWRSKPLPPPLAG